MPGKVDGRASYRFAVALTCIGLTLIGCASGQNPDDSCFGDAILARPSTIPSLTVGDSVEVRAGLNSALPCLYPGVRSVRFEWRAAQSGIVQVTVVNDSTALVKALQPGETVLIGTGNGDGRLSVLINVKVVRPD